MWGTALHNSYTSYLGTYESILRLFLRILYSSTSTVPYGCLAVFVCYPHFSMQLFVLLALNDWIDIGFEDPRGKHIWDLSTVVQTWLNLIMNAFLSAGPLLLPAIWTLRLFLMSYRICILVFCCSPWKIPLVSAFTVQIASLLEASASLYCVT